MDRKTSFITYSVIFVILIVLALWVVKPFILSIIGGIIVAYIFYPVHRWLVRRIKSKGWSAFIVSVLIVLIFTAPFLFLVQAFAKDAYVSYVLIKQKVSSTFFTGELQSPCPGKGIGCSLINWIRSFTSQSQTKFYFDDTLNKITQFAVSKAQDVVVKLPSIFLQVFVVLFVIYYALKDGEALIKKSYKIFPVKRAHYTIMVDKVKEMTSSTIYGVMVVAAIQGAFAGLGYFIFGVESPVLLGVMTALAALLPVVGTALVWVPVVAVHFFNAAVAGNDAGMALALGLLAYCIFPVSTIDNFIRPKIIGQRAKVHPILVLLGILGGVAAFGFVGVLLGPIIITLFVTFADIYQEERLDHEASG